MKYAAKTPWLFLGPQLGLFTLFVLAPVCAVFVISFYDWSLLGDHRFIGLTNYLEIVEDREFWRALSNTVLYALMVVPLTLLAGLGLALALDSRVSGRRLFRTAIYLPTVLSSVASATAAAWIFDDQYGVLNAFLLKFGFERVPWLSSTHFAMGSLVTTTVWVRIGLCMVVYLAALQEISPSLLQAAELDGAGPVNRFRFIIWPLLRPSTLFLAVTTLIYSLQAFDLAYVLTNGGPAFSTTMLVQYLYNAAYLEQRQGYASAISVILLLILIGFSSLLLLRRRKAT